MVRAYLNESPALFKTNEMLKGCGRGLFYEKNANEEILLSLVPRAAG